VQPGKASVTPSSIRKAMSLGGSEKTVVMAHPWRLVEDCSKHMQLPRETHGRRASGRPNIRVAECRRTGGKGSCHWSRGHWRGTAFRYR